MKRLDISLLYVEDEDYIRENMVTSLTRRVRTIYSAANGEEGYQKYLKEKPDLIITDIRMPVMNGLEMIKKIRSHRDNTKIIMLSAHSDTKSLLEAIEIGVNGYVLKPFKTKKLFELIDEQAKHIILDKKVKDQSHKINELYTALMKDIDTAGSVQEYMLPDYLIIEPDMFFSSTYVPSTKIGGDLFDVISISKHEYIAYIGDISGHGVKAALLMTAVKTTINRIIEDEKLSKPHQILNRLNSILSKELFSSDYMTVLLCYINCEDNIIKILNAGHPPLILYNTIDKTITICDNEGSIPIGWMPNYLYTPDEEYESTFDENHIMILYTDGLFECENKKGVELGLEGLQNYIHSKARNYPTALLPLEIKNALLKDNYNISGDDFTLMALRKIPVAESQKSLSLFAGNLKTEMYLIIDNAADFARKELASDTLASAISQLKRKWLYNIIEINRDAIHNGQQYLCEIKGLDKSNLQITIWSKYIFMVEDADNNNDQDAMVIFSDKLKIEYQHTHYKGFDQLAVKIQFN